MLTTRRLAVMLEQVPVVTTTGPDWDTPQGEALIREAIAIRDRKVMGLDTMGEALGIERFRYIVLARERYLT